MPFVLDASVAASWAFEDEDHPKAAIAFDRLRRDEAQVPALWWFEVRNTLVVSERRGRITAADTSDFLRRMGSLRITTDRACEEWELLALARRHRLTVYDASYLELARRTGLALATLDSDLVRASRTENVGLIGEE